MFGINPAIGSELETSMYDQAKRGLGEQVPYVLYGCDKFLRTALATPGLFRQDVEAQELTSLRARVEAAYADRRPLELGTLTRNWHAVASLFKLYLRELPTPLLSFDAYHLFVMCATSQGSQMHKLTQLAELLGGLTSTTLRSVSLVLSLLHDTSLLNAVMTAKELAKIFTPLLLRAPSTASIQDCAHVEAMVALLISNGASSGALLSSAATSVQSAPPRSIAPVSIDDIGRQLSDVNVDATRSNQPAGNKDKEIQWYYIDSQQNYVGPVDAHGMKQLYLHQYVTSETYVWAENLTGWQQLASVPQFNDVSQQLSGGPKLQALRKVAAAAASEIETAVKSRQTAVASPVSHLQDGHRHYSASCAQTPPASLDTPGSRGNASITVAVGGVVAPPSLGIARKRQSPANAEGVLAHESNSGVPALPSIASPGAGTVGIQALGGLRGVRPPVASTPLMISSGPVATTTGTSPVQAIAIAAGGGGSSDANVAASACNKSLSIPIPQEGYWQGDRSEGRGLRILAGAEGKVRAIIADDGEVRDGCGNILAYIESNGEVGDANMNYAGRAHGSTNQVVDHLDSALGEFDPGRGYVKDREGSVVAEMAKEGTITNNGGQSIGVVEGFRYSDMQTLSAYFLLVDPSFVRAQSMH